MQGKSTRGKPIFQLLHLNGVVGVLQRKYFENILHDVPVAPPLPPHPFIQESLEVASPYPLPRFDALLQCAPGRLNVLSMNTRIWVYEIARMDNDFMLGDVWEEVVQAVVCSPVICVHHAPRKKTTLDDGQQACSIPALHHLEVASGRRKLRRHDPKHPTAFSWPPSSVELRDFGVSIRILPFCDCVH